MPLVYDAGALVATERRSTRAWTLHREALRSEITPTLPAAVLGQVWRGRPSQANLARFLRGCDITPDTEELARAAGVACGAAGTADVVDAWSSSLHASSPPPS